MSKLILAALDQEAMVAIDFNREKPEQVFTIELTTLELDYLFKSGLVDELNQECKAMIDEFEDEVLVGRETLSRALVVLEKFRYQHSAFLPFIERLANVCKEALARDTALYFFL